MNQILSPKILRNHRGTQQTYREPKLENHTGKSYWKLILGTYTVIQCWEMQATHTGRNWKLLQTHTGTYWKLLLGTHNGNIYWEITGNAYRGNYWDLILGTYTGTHWEHILGIYTGN